MWPDLVLLEEARWCGLIAAPASTGSTADFTAVMYQAARSFESKDRAQSLRFRTAADRAWDWLTKHSNVPAHDLVYIDHDPAGELLWATSERALEHHQDSPALARQITERPQAEVSWVDPSLLGLYNLASSPASPPHLREAAHTVIL